MTGWREMAAEFTGTALLLLLGLSAVVADFAAHSPVVAAVPSVDLRRLLTGVLFAGSATLIVYSPLGRISGGHINPAVTLAFYRLGKMTGRSAAGYAAAQVAGAILGTVLVLLLWGSWATDVQLGATVPGTGGVWACLAAEAAATFLLVALILNLVDRPRLMPYTAAAAGLLVATLVFVEAPVSGTSLNPARSLGPALVGGTWTGWWVYLIAPPAGALAAAVLYRRRRRTVACGKLIHDDAYACPFLDCRYTPPERRVRRVRSRRPCTGGIPVRRSAASEAVRHKPAVTWRTPTGAVPTPVRDPSRSPERSTDTMKAIGVFPGQAGSAHLIDVPRPALEDIPHGRGVMVRILRLGLDGTDKEINAGEYGTAPAGQDYLITGHESLGRVEEIGPAVTEFAPGDYVVARVRRAGDSLYDLIDTPDMTTDDAYYEHGISRVNGFLTEYYVEDPRYLIKIPQGLNHVAVLLEPTSVAEKGIIEAYEIQRRLKVWQPRRAAVLGAGTIGLLATVILRNRGLAVTTFGLDEPPYLNSDLAEAVGAAYISTKQQSLAQNAAQTGGYDLVFEATGYSPIVFDAMCHLVAKNGILVLSSVTGGMRRSEVPSDAINLDFVLGNKVMFGTVNANREHFEAGVRDLAVAEAQYPGWLSRLLTHPVHGLDHYDEALAALGAPGAIKVFVEIAGA
ncbi:aquaporin [Streptomyces sp. NPDC005727]|uniref:aquaporin n=1 Tax=Streptomyces sp. NPDC005727 TaxID=3157053 RepID=UPI0033F4EFC4